VAEEKDEQKEGEAEEGGEGIRRQTQAQGDN
jgi:hypothetical protein